MPKDMLDQIKACLIFSVYSFRTSQAVLPLIMDAGYVSSWWLS
jgi:hypothetical protein